MITDSTTTTVELANGVKMPMLGFGTATIKEPGEAERTVAHALRVGYRHIDTATAYENQKGVGIGVRDSGVPREEVFLTTKCWNPDIRKGYQAALDACRWSLDQLGMDYVDLYLLHWPIVETHREVWKAMEKLYANGLVRAIGVSNYHESHFNDLLPAVEIIPMVNQVEFHPLLMQNDLRAFCAQRNIAYEAWSPIMQGKCRDYPSIVEVATRHGKSPEQILLRWDLQHGVTTIPRSSNEQRITANTQIFDFELSDREMAQIDALDVGQRLGPHPDNCPW